MTDPHFALTFAPVQIEVSQRGDFAYVRGTYHHTLSSPTTRQPLTRSGKYIVIYRKSRGGRWEAIHDINNRESR